MRRWGLLGICGPWSASWGQKPWPWGEPCSSGTGDRWPGCTAPGPSSAGRWQLARGVGSAGSRRQNRALGFGQCTCAAGCRPSRATPPPLPCRRASHGCSRAAGLRMAAARLECAQPAAAAAVEVSTASRRRRRRRPVRGAAGCPPQRQRPAARLARRWTPARVLSPRAPIPPCRQHMGHGRGFTSTALPHAAQTAVAVSARPAAAQPHRKARPIAGQPCTIAQLYVDWPTFSGRAAPGGP
jgi:hypothetical protein